MLTQLAREQSVVLASPLEYSDEGPRVFVRASQLAAVLEVSGWTENSMRQALEDLLEERPTKATSLFVTPMQFPTMPKTPAAMPIYPCEPEE